MGLSLICKYHAPRVLNRSHLRAISPNLPKLPTVPIHYIVGFCHLPQSQNIIRILKVEPYLLCALQDGSVQPRGVWVELPRPSGPSHSPSSRLLLFSHLPNQLTKRTVGEMKKSSASLPLPPSSLSLPSKSAPVHIDRAAIIF